MKSKWIETTVGEIADAIQYGYTESSTIQNIGPKFLRITDIQNGKVDWQTVPYCQCDELDKYKLEEGDILFARTGATTGKSFLVKDCPKTVFASYLIRVRLKREILPNYVYQFFQTPVYWNQIKQFTTGSTQGGFNASKLAEIKIPLPPLSIQQQIAAILEKADAAREKRRQANRLTEQFLQSAFLEMFGDPATNPKGWPVEKLSEVAEIKMGQSPDGDSYNDAGLGFPLLNGPAEFGIKFPKEKQWTTKPTKFSNNGDILFCVRGATAGRMNWADKQYCIGRGLAAISSNGKCSNAYLYYLLELNYDYFQSIGQGSTFINISREVLSNLAIPIPEGALQQKFSTIFEKVESLRAKQRQSEQELEHLFHSLMQRAFRGELGGNRFKLKRRRNNKQ
jgi:type I restriction enzyme S subunit